MKVIKADIRDEVTERVINKKTLFIRGGGINLTVQQQALFDVLLYIATKAYSKAMVQNVIYVDLLELKDIMQKHIRSRSTQSLLDVCEGLCKHTFTFNIFRDKDEGNYFKSDKKEYGCDGLVYNFTVSEDTIIAKFKLSDFMVEVLNSQAGDPTFTYSSLPLSISCAEKNKHVLRLYQLFIDFYRKSKYHTIPNLSLNDIRAFLGVNYSTYKDLNKCIIKPAMKILNEKYKLFLSVTPKKDGANVTHLAFKIGKDFREPHIMLTRDMHSDKLLSVALEHVEDSNVQYFNSKISSHFSAKNIRIYRGREKLWYFVDNGQIKKIYSFESLKSCCIDIDRKINFPETPYLFVGESSYDSINQHFL